MQPLKDKMMDRREELQKSAREKRHEGGEGACVCVNRTGGEGGTENVQNGRGTELTKETGGKAETILNASTR